MSEISEEEFMSGAELANSRIVSAKGNEEGLVLRIDGRSEWREIVRDVEAFLSPKKTFFKGGNVSIEWLDRLPTKEQSGSLEELLQTKYSISVIARKKPQVKARASRGEAQAIPLFNVEGSGTSENGVSRSGRKRANSVSDAVAEGEMSPGELLEFAGLTGGAPGEGYLERMEKILAEDVLYEDDANTKTIFGTVRSGQRVETPFSLIVVGDVNPGADLVAGGDIIVVGSLRGTAHAAAYEEEATGRVIIALQMRPIQLRIGSVISRGSDDMVEGAEIARIEDRRIVVECYNSRMNFSKRLRA